MGWFTQVLAHLASSLVTGVALVIVFGPAGFVATVGMAVATCMAYLAAVTFTHVVLSVFAFFVIIVTYYAQVIRDGIVNRVNKFVTGVKDEMKKSIQDQVDGAMIGMKKTVDEAVVGVKKTVSNVTPSMDTLKNIVTYGALALLVYRVFKRWVDSRKPKEEALQLTRRIWNIVDTIIVLLSLPILWKNGADATASAVKSMRFWASWARSLFSGFTLAASLSGLFEGDTPQLAKAVDDVSAEVIKRTEPISFVKAEEEEQKHDSDPGSIRKKAARLAGMSEEEYTKWMAAEGDEAIASVRKLYDDQQVAVDAQSLEIQLEASQASKRSKLYWGLTLGILLAILIGVTMYIYWTPSKPKEESKGKKKEEAKGKNKKKRDFQKRRWEYDPITGERIYNTDDDDYDQPDAWNGYAPGEEARKPVCPVWQQNRGKCKSDGSICDEFYHPKEWKQPCTNPKCPGTAKCGKPHVARRAPKSTKPQQKEEAQLAEPLVPIGKAFNALAQVNCIVDGELHKSTNGLLIFGRLFVPHHLWRDAKGKISFQVRWADKSVMAVEAQPVKVGNLDLGYIPIVAPGRKSLSVAVPVAGQKITTLAIRDDEMETSTGYMLTVSEYEATHSVTTAFGHCCCAFLNEFGRVVGIHVRGSSKEGYIIPLTPEVVQLMMSKNL